MSDETRNVDDTGARTRAIDDRLLEVVGTLAAQGWPAVEVYAKRGRSRVLTMKTRREASKLHEEEGWAVRAGDDRRSFFQAVSGRPNPATSWPEADGHGLRLPEEQTATGWAPPPDLDAPLLGENEARGLLRGIDRALDTELPGARLLHAELSDGSSEAQLASSRGMRAVVRQRTASLYLEARGPRDHKPGSVSLIQAARGARHFHPLALARRLADRLLVATRGEAPARDRGEFLLAPPVATRLLAALVPLVVGPGATDRLAAFADRRGRIGSGLLTLIDDGRLPGGLLEAPVDGEGVPTREMVLIDAGRVRQPLLGWRQAKQTQSASGCCLRPSWRDEPTAGATHLFVPPDPESSVASMLGDVTRGYYLLDVEGAIDADLDGDRFAAPVCGFGIDAGQPTGAVSGAWLTGSITSLLHGIVALGRDLTFLPLGGMIGAPSMLIRGLELRRRP